MDLGGTMFSRFIFWFWLLTALGLISLAIRENRLYGGGILAALLPDLLDHWILRTIACAPQGFPAGCMDTYAYTHLHLHQLEWVILDSVFVGVERHYGDPAYAIVEFVFVGALCAAIWRLKRRTPLDQTGEVSSETSA